VRLCWRFNAGQEGRLPLLGGAEVLGMDDCLRLDKFSLGDRLSRYTKFGGRFGYWGCYAEGF
jgi:hypothetical protein